MQLTGAEMNQISSLTENSLLDESIMLMTQAAPERIETLWDWISRAWRRVHPYINPTKSGDSSKCNNLDQTQKNN